MKKGGLIYKKAHRDGSLQKQKKTSSGIFQSSYKPPTQYHTRRSWHPQDQEPLLVLLAMLACLGTRSERWCVLSIVLLTVELHSSHHQNPTDASVQTQAFYPTGNKEEHETCIMLYMKMHHHNSGSLHFLSLCLLKQWTQLSFWYWNICFFKITL